MGYINKKDTNGLKPLLQEGELGYDKYPAGGDEGRMYVGTGSENIAIAKKSEVDNLDTLKAPLASPSLTGTPTAPTAVVGTNTTQLATTEFVQAEIANDTYSKTELDSGQLDSRYYTETEIDSLLEAQNDASEIAVVPVGNLESTNVQEGLEELQGDIDIRYTKTETDTLLTAVEASALAYSIALG